ncbi:phosphatase PAP2 family protein [Natrarchaeobius sp. A-rgal3]|uniref:phosphatase PAP2 family protein n=1 Tax=Natrarchaeobius versutus TaxID=1679078 RepID=UPI00350FE9B9
MRLEDESAVIREGFPAEYADLVLVVTELGGTTVPMVLLAVLFWLSSRRRNALVISYAVAGVCFVVVAKELFGLPRPPTDAFLVPYDTDDLGFPSGHAFAATIVYGGLLVAYDRVRDPGPVLAVAAVVTVVALSRVILGVHYLSDVLAGFALGLGFLGVMTYATRREPQRGFAIALGIAAVALVVVGVNGYVLLGLGGSIGGLVATVANVDRPALRSRLEGGVLVVVGMAGIVAVQAATDLLTAVPILVASYGLLFGWILLAPAAVARVPLERLASSPANA